MDSYINKINFKNTNNLYIHTNTIGVSDILINEYNCQLTNKKQSLNDGIVVYPDYILCTPSFQSYTVHVFTGTWTEEKETFWRKTTTFLRGNSNNKLFLILLLFLKKVRNYINLM